MEKEKIVVSKKLNGAPVSVTLSSTELKVAMALSDYMSNLAEEACAGLAEAAAKAVGNPTLLVTNAQLLAKMQAAINPRDVFDALAKASVVVIDELKKASVVAE